MGDMLSQEEINALLSGMASEEGGAEGDAGDNSFSESTDATPTIESDFDNSVDNLTDMQIDTIGEIGNISMGTSATTLSALLGQKVMITTPEVMLTNWGELASSFDRPCVGIRVDYSEGVKGTNVLILNERDVKIITNLMMGGDGTEDVDEEINDLDLSAIGEAMNQMIGSSATSLSSMTDHRIDINTPEPFLLDFKDSNFMDKLPNSDEQIVCTQFRMEIGTLIDSNIMQVWPLDFAFGMVKMMNEGLDSYDEPVEIKTEAPAPPKAEPAPVPTPVHVEKAPEPVVAPEAPYVAEETIPIMEEEPSAPYSRPKQKTSFRQNVNVQPAQFQDFDVGSVMQQKENIDIIMDVPLEISVELGRTSKKIKEILEFTPGTIIELDKIAGEPIDILVNGKFVANGEVVVIDENFGIRVTDIINVEHRV